MGQEALDEMEKSPLWWRNKTQQRSDVSATSAWCMVHSATSAKCIVHSKDLMVVHDASKNKTQQRSDGSAWCNASNAI